MNEPQAGEQSDREAVERLLNLIASDPAVRQDLLRDPTGTLIALGMPISEPAVGPRRQCDWTCIKSGTCSRSCQVTCDVTG